MESILKVAAIAVASVLCMVVVKKQTPEIGVVLGLLAGTIILFLTIPAFRNAKELMEQLADTANISPAVLTPVIKTVGIAIITKLAAEICKDAKEGGVAAFVEMAGAALALVVCVPLIEAVLAMVGEML